MAKKVKVTSDQLAKNWGQGMRSAGPRIESGVSAVTESPGIAAARQKDLWVRNTTSAANKWATNVGRVSLDSWKETTIKKGIPALQNAVSLAEPKVQQAANILIPALNDALSSMPARGATLEENMNRVLHVAKRVRAAFAK